MSRLHIGLNLMAPWLAALVVVAGVLFWSNHFGERTAEAVAVTTLPIFDPGMVLIDVRPTAAYAAGHIAGSESLPFVDGRFQEDPFRRLEDWRSASTVCVYCSSSTCRDAHIVANYLQILLGRPVCWYVPGYQGSLQ